MLRRAVADDLDRLVELAERYCAADGHRFDRRRVVAGFEPLLVSDEFGVVWMVVDHGEPVGYAVLTWSWSIESGGRDALLDEIYVDSPGRGLGSQAVAEIVVFCRDRGIPRIFLETEAVNEAARRLYARHGFRVEDSVWMVAET